MKLPYSWLAELTGLDWSPTEMADKLTMSGTYVEEIEPAGRHFDRVVVGKVESVAPVPNSTKIQLTTVSTGSELLQIVCGAPNVATGQHVAVALPGAVMANGMKIAVGEIRGVQSQGMICSESELGISHDHGGIMVLERSMPVGSSLRDALGYDDWILHFELTPNRGDSHSAIGIARDLAALAGTRLRLPQSHLVESGESAMNAISVEIENPNDCPRFTARIVRNCRNGQSPWWLKRKLLLSGVRPISTLVDITNLVLLETGNPLHAFDYDRFASNRIVVRRAASGEMLTTLDGKERRLTSDVLLVTDGTRARAAAGVMGGFDSEVTDQTATVLLEAAFFNPSVIRKSRRVLDLSSEASHRFERGVDHGNLIAASERACALISELCGGHVAPGVVDSYPRTIAPVQISFRPSFCNRILGTTYSSERMDQVLTLLDCTVEASSSGETKIVTVPTFRSDLTQEYDLIEEIARIEGYHTIPEATRTKGPLYTPLHDDDLKQEELRSLLTGAGFDEIMGHGLAHSKKLMMVAPDQAVVKILNPVTDDLDVMRSTLIVNLLETIGHNLSHRNLSLKLFELGRIYLPEANGTAAEPAFLGMAVCGQTEGNWRDKSRPLDLHDLKGGIDTIAAHYRLPSIRFVAEQFPWSEKGKAFRILSGSLSLGRIGHVSPAILKKFEIKLPVVVAELPVGELLKQAVPLPAFEPLPVFPAAPRDLAIVVDLSHSAASIIEQIRLAAGDLAASVGIFDEYTGSQIPQGKRSLAITIEYRAGDRSLSGEEVEERQQAVVAALREKFQAEVRDK